MATLIVGASVAGIRTAQALRMHGYTDPVIVIGEERHLPYDKPPISKEMLALSGGDRVALLSDEQLAELELDLRLGVRADGLDLQARVVHTSDGDSIGFDHLVIATGVTPRTLPEAAELRGVHTLRTAEDAAAVRALLGLASKTVVIGAGFIGAEFASAARHYGVSVDIVEPQEVPMSHVLGARVGAELARMHAINGVTVHAGARVAGLTGDGSVEGVTLSDGRTLPADLVVIGIGADPATGWLEDSGLTLDNGVVCDDRLRAVGAERVYAAGDVARWPSPHADGLVRIEHWTNAGEHAALVASTIVGADAPTPPPPYVWSDQYGHRLQIVGRPTAGEIAGVVGSIDQLPYAAIYGSHDGLIVGAVVVDDPRLLMKLRRAIATRAEIASLDLGLVPAT